MKISSKLLVAGLVIVVVASGLAGSTLLIDRRIEATTDRGDAGERVSELVIDLAVSMGEYGAQRDPETAAELDAGRAELSDLATDRSLWGDTADRIRAYADLVGQIVAVYDAAAASGADADEVQAEVGALSGSMSAEILGLIEAAGEIRRAERASALSASRAGVRWGLGFTAVALAIVAGAGVWIYLGVARPIGRLTLTAKQIAAGDFTASAPQAGKDELATLGAAFNAMTERLQLMIAALEEEVEERRQAENSLRSSRLRSESILETAPDGILTLDEEGTVESVNVAAAALFGYPPADLVGQDYNTLMLSPIIDPDTNYATSELSGHAQLVLAREREVVGRRANGSTFPMQLSVSELRLDGQRAFTWIVRDLTERNEARQQIEESDARSRAILQTAADAIVTIDEQGVIQSANPATEQLFAYAADELIGQRLTLLMPALDQDPANGSLADYGFPGAERIAGKGHEVAGRRKDGTTFSLHLSMSEVQLGETRIFTGIARDLTELKRAEDDLRALNRTLEEQVAERTAAVETRAEELARSNAELEQFAYVASHDLQEPLRMVASFTQMLQRSYGDQLDEAAHQYIEHAVDGARRMQVLINDLLAYSRVGTRGKELAYVELDDALNVALSNLEAAIEESGAEIRRGELPAVQGDMTQIVQLLQNLIGNAVKFRGDDAPMIEVSAQRLNGTWQISVRDHGIGIEPGYADRIFVIFQRLHTREQYAGTGIGLAICKKVVERHGGRIWLESAAGEGSTFHFTLRAATESRAAA